MSKPSAAAEPLDQHQILRSVREQDWGKEDIELGSVGTQTISWESSVMYRLRRQHHPHPSSLPKAAVWKDLYQTHKDLSNPRRWSSCRRHQITLSSFYFLLVTKKIFACVMHQVTLQKQQLPIPTCLLPGIMFPFICSVTIHLNRHIFLDTWTNFVHIWQSNLTTRWSLSDSVPQYYW